MKIRKFSKKMLMLVLSISLFVSVCVPFIAKAIGSTNSLTITFRGEKVGGNVYYSLDGGQNWVDVASNLNSLPISLSADHLMLKVVSVGGYTVDPSGIELSLDGTIYHFKDISNENHADFSIWENMVLNGQGYEVPSNVTSVALTNVEFREEGDDPELHGPEFDGQAYYMWQCGNDVCYHKFTDLVGRDFVRDEHGEIVYENDQPVEFYQINYIAESALTDQSGHNVNYDIDLPKDNEHPANWVLARDVEDEHGDIDPSKLTPAYIFGVGVEGMGVQLDPCGAFSGENSNATNGDRNFRAMIYRDGYEAIEFDNSVDKYTYYPGFWDPVFFSNTIDVSGSSKDLFYSYSIYMLEPSLHLKTGAHSKSKITSIEPVYAADGAVTVTKDGDEFTITFNSNFYDYVLFEATSAAGDKYYFAVERMVSHLYDDLGPGHSLSKLTYEFYYPSNTNYSDYSVVATITYKDGSVETRELEPTIINDFYGGDPLPISFYAGKNLKGSAYVVNGNENIDTVSFNVVMNNAFASTRFGGAFSGSGLGETYDMSYNGHGGVLSREVK